MICFAGKYGCDTGTVEEALQDVMVAVLNHQEVYSHKTYNDMERLIWRSIDNRLKYLYARSIKRRQIEGEYVDEG